MISSRRKKLMEIWKCSRSCAKCVWFGTSGLCRKQQCEAHGKRPKETKALTCRWYSKKIASIGSSRKEKAEVYHVSDEWISRFRNEWETTAKETTRLLEETSEG